MIVNEVKRVKFLGYAFYQRKGEMRVRIHRKSTAKMRNKTKEIYIQKQWNGKRRRYIMEGKRLQDRADTGRTYSNPTDEWMRRRIRI